VLKRTLPYPASTEFDGTLGSATFARGTFFEYNYFYGAASGDTGRFFFEPIIEQVGPDAYVSIEGVAEGSMAGPISELTLSGSFAYCERRDADRVNFFECSVAPLECASRAHRLTVARQ
jgi:hypothetical protein